MKACPFCGGVGYCIEISEGHWTPGCDPCGYSLCGPMASGYYDSKENAEAAWNARADILPATHPDYARID